MPNMSDLYTVPCLLILMLGRGHAIIFCTNSFDSLVVGCPLCNREKGRIYFFENMQGVVRHFFETHIYFNGYITFALQMFSNGVEIDSPIESQGRFGMTVENIGDIDLDGYEGVC